MADGLGFHVPKGYLYAAIGFSILIEFLTSWRGQIRKNYLGVNFVAANGQPKWS